MRRKGRKIRPLEPLERKQYAPGQLVANLNPGIRQNIERLAVYGYGRDGRGALIVEISEETDSGIVSAQYFYQ